MRRDLRPRAQLASGRAKLPTVESASPVMEGRQEGQSAELVLHLAHEHFYFFYVLILGCRICPFLSLILSLIKIWP